MTKTMSKIALAMVMLAVLAVPALTLASAWDINGPGNYAVTNMGMPNKSLSQMILDVTNWLVGFIIILAFLIIVYGGVRYVAAAGSDDEVAAAKKIITYGVIGLVVAGLSWVIVYTVVSVILK